MLCLARKCGQRMNVRPHDDMRKELQRRILILFIYIESAAACSAVAAEVIVNPFYFIFEQSIFIFKINQFFGKNISKINIMKYKFF